MPFRGSFVSRRQTRNDRWLLNNRKRDAIVRNNYWIIKMKGIVSATDTRGESFIAFYAFDT